MTHHEIATRAPSASTTPVPAAYGWDRLGPQDVQALCAHLGLPLPTPDVPLSAIAERAGHTAESIYRSLERTTSVRLMIAASLLRVPVKVAGVTYCPPDPRLRPRPHAPAPVSRPRTEREVRRAPPPPPPPAPPVGDLVVLWVAPNPKKLGSESYSRFALYRVGARVSELLAAGLRSADVRWDTERDFVRLGPPPEGQP